MKIIYIFAITTSLFIISCNNQSKTTANSENTKKIISENDNIEEFGKTVFNLIKTNDYKKILDLFPSVDEYKNLIKKSELSESKKNNSLKNLERSLKNDVSLLKKSYDDLQRYAEKSGINWEQCSIKYIDYRHTKSNNIENADIFLFFTFKGIKYQIKLNNCVRMSNKWKIGDRIKWVNNTYNYDDIDI